MLCPSPQNGRVRAADLTDHNPTFRNRRLSAFRSDLGAAIAP